MKLDAFGGSLVSQSETGDPAAQADLARDAIVEAVEKQLGLKIESIKAAEEVLVIDRVERPSAN